MSRTIIAFIVFSLLGLIVIQVGLLRIGQMTEMEKYDTEVKAVMHNVRTDLYRNTPLSERIANLSKDIDQRSIFNSDSLPYQTLKEIDTLLKEQLAARGISVDYSFALTDKENNLLLTSNNFDANRFHFNRYTARLGMAETICKCPILLHFYQKNIYSYLFSQLAYLLIPSLLFLFTIVTGFSFLIYTLNRQRRLLTIKNDFINNLTHELKTPVFSISLLVKVFKENLKIIRRKNWKVI